MAVVRLDTEGGVFEGLDYRPLEQDGLFFCVRIRQCVFPPLLTPCPKTKAARSGTSTLSRQYLGY